MFVAYFAANFYTYGLNAIQPTIAADLNGMALYAWGVSLPALAAALAIVVFSKLSDIYGRKALILVTMLLFMAGSLLAAISPTFPFAIGARVVLGLGHGALSPLVFSGIGDLFAPAERSKWSGLMNIPAGVSALIAPTMIGMLSDHFSWRTLYWIMLPILMISGALVWAGLPAQVEKITRKIDLPGTAVLAAACGTLILAFSWAGDLFPWGSPQIMALFTVSGGLWIAFMIRQSRTPDPIIDPQVLTNRTFITAAGAAWLSLFGMMGVTLYYPLFLQGVQGASATLSGQMITPFSMLMTFMGVPVGFLLAKTKRYKWMFLIGYGILTLCMFMMTGFSEATPVWLSVLITGLAGVGLGAMPTLNTLVVQFAAPRRLLGVAVGAMYFVVMMGVAIAPSILGSLMNVRYARVLVERLPPTLSQVLDAEALAAAGDPRILVSPAALAALERSLSGAAPAGLFEQTVAAIRNALEESLKLVYRVGAITMLASLLLILTIPEIAIETEKL